MGRLEIALAGCLVGMGITFWALSPDPQALGQQIGALREYSRTVSQEKRLLEQEMAKLRKQNKDLESDVDLAINLVLKEREEHTRELNSANSGGGAAHDRVYVFPDKEVVIETATPSLTAFREAMDRAKR